MTVNGQLITMTITVVNLNAWLIGQSQPMEQSGLPTLTYWLVSCLHKQLLYKKHAESAALEIVVCN
jgi:hypothetical protein